MAWAKWRFPVGAGLAANQAIFASVEALHLKFLSRLNPVLLPEFGRQNDLALRRYSRLHLVRYRLTPDGVKENIAESLAGLRSFL